MATCRLRGTGVFRTGFVVSTTGRLSLLSFSTGWLDRGSVLESSGFTCRATGDSRGTASGRLASARSTLLNEAAVPEAGEDATGLSLTFHWKGSAFSGMDGTGITITSITNTMACPAADTAHP